MIIIRYLHCTHFYKMHALLLFKFKRRFSPNYIYGFEYQFGMPINWFCSSNIAIILYRNMIINLF